MVKRFPLATAMDTCGDSTPIGVSKKARNSVQHSRRTKKGSWILVTRQHPAREVVRLGESRPSPTASRPYFNQKGHRSILSISSTFVKDRNAGPLCYSSLNSLREAF